MYVFENPVLQRELLVNLRTLRAFVLLALYQMLLSAVVIAAWPSDTVLDLTSNPQSAKQLVDLFFLGQYVIASLMAPSFAAGAITGEKERLTYEMLLASPLRPGAVILGKMVASLTHLGMLILGSLPIIVLCLPLGGVSVYEVLAAYTGLISDHNYTWCSQFKQSKTRYKEMLEEVVKQLEDALNKLDKPTDVANMLGAQ